MSSGYYIAGRNSVLEALRSARAGSVKKMYIARGAKGLDEPRGLAQDLGISIEETEKGRITELVGTDSHQSIVLLATPPQREDVGEFLERTADRPQSLVIALDAVYDPQNLGTILRAAECFGADAVLWSKNRGSTITPVVTKVSVGASELVNILQVSNLAQSLQKFKDAGYWVVAADGGEGSEDLTGFTYPEKAVLVLGSEGEGVSRLLLKEADFRVRIPMSGSIDSLNVSQASAVFLYSALLSRKA